VRREEEDFLLLFLWEESWGHRGGKRRVIGVGEVGGDFRV
jgi:hypothetical protein